MITQEEKYKAATKAVEDATQKLREANLLVDETAEADRAAFQRLSWAQELVYQYTIDAVQAEKEALRASGAADAAYKAYHKAVAARDAVTHTTQEN